MRLIYNDKVVVLYSMFFPLSAYWQKAKVFGAAWYKGKELYLLIYEGAWRIYLFS